MNRPTPIFNPLYTDNVWLLIYVPSAIISLNQNDMDKIKEVKLNNRLYSAKAKPWNDKTADVVRVNKLIDVYKGQGEGETRWNDKTADVVRVNKLIDVYKGQGEGETRWKGCAWKLLLFRFNIIIDLTFL
jgi:hypothetical protein